MRQRGFTLIELVITVAIVGLLATAALPLAQLNVKRTKEMELHAAEREIRSAIDAYKDAATSGRIMVDADASGYPPDLATLANGVEDAQSPDNNMIYFLRRVPRDPFYPDPNAMPEDTWGLRSSQSAPYDPQPGEDVFDVYSLSNGVGLNGVPYRDW